MTRTSHMPKGLFRFRGEPRLVQVQFGPFSRPISENEYVVFAYQPPLADLPWQRTIQERRNSADKDDGADHVS